MAKKDKKLWIDGCMGSELKDTQGETLSVEGADISELEAGRGRWNDNHGKGFFNSLGTITEAKKIFKAEDCENERHTYYWEKIKAPYIYGKGYLFNDEDHSNAKACAAILRNIHREDSPLKVKLSVEGGVLSRGISDSTRLARTKIHSCAVTFTPANNATLCEPLNLDKSSTDWEADKRLIKSVMHLAETDIPSFRHIERHASAHTIHDNIVKIQELSKALGIEIEIKNSDPKDIMQKAVLSKIASSVYKMNDMVKAINQKRTDAFQQGQSGLNSTLTPKTPKDLNDSSSDTYKVRSASQVKATNTLKSHAGKMMRDPEHENVIHRSLTDKGIHPDKITAIMGKIKSHMTKAEESDEIEKGDISRAAKNLVVAGAMAAGAVALSPKDEEPKPPKEAITQEEKIKAHNAKTKNENMKIRLKKSKKEHFKSKLKKALTAGYGGAGAPGALTGGGVMQSEALDDGRGADKGMAYIVCENCGKEQVHMQHQVKCRDCKKNFSLDKLKSLL